MRKAKGFTLIELLTVVAIIGIIAAIAYPSYMNSLRKGRRSDGQTALTNAAQALERCYTAYGKYNSDSCSMASTLTGAGFASQQNFYVVTASSISATSFTLTAIGQGQQADDPDCTNMELKNTGAKTPTDCW
ncbi:MAG TPA: type IV pilin protein [Gammaproteobacteria bacterium]|nr:type IV pilin protein [Gammaproteobacteria bacterium]